MIGQAISHYRILEKLGEGGMGVVYKAQDTKLNRIVALKFLPQHLTSTKEEAARFTQEAQAAATLNHPNICTIHAIDEYEGQQFIDMEYVEGKTLKERIGGSGAKFQEAIAYAIQIGEALQEAHNNGIVHRDIKAENIMVNVKNQIKVMDFGLAKLKGSLKLTRTSSTVGTAAYMAPEQLQGGDVDARSDIFSFGVVLYEMLTGKPPFRGEHEAALMYSIVNENPPPPSGLKPDLPAEADRIVLRALEKDPEDRYQHADEMVSELRRLLRQTTRVVRPVTEPAPVPRDRRSARGRALLAGAGILAVLVGVAAFLIFRGFPAHQGQGTKKKLVVLPFVNQGTPDQDYFADGITEEITSRLSGLSGLAVIAHSSALTYKKSDKSIKQIGEELGVSYILQGTVRWETSNGVQRTRVTPQLINVADGTQIWSEPTESVLADAFRLESEIAGSVARSLDVALLQPERKSLESNLTSNPEAYDYYLRGLSALDRSYGGQDLKLGADLFAKAVALDPQFASAYANLSNVDADIYWEYYDHTEARLQKAKEAADKALTLDPELAAAHMALGMYLYHGRLDYDGSMREFNRALAIMPNYPEALMGVGAVERRQGKFEEAATNIAKAVQIDPRSGGLQAELAITYFILRRYPEAERTYDNVLLLSPEWPEPYATKSALYVNWTGDMAQARAVLQDGTNRKIDPQDPRFVMAWVNVDAMSGDYQSALDRLERFEANAFDIQEYYTPVDLLRGQLYGYLQRHAEERNAYDAARILLEKCVREHPEDARFHGSLGIAYAGLGRKQDAMREGKLAVEEMPIAKEALRGLFRAQELALIYTKVGERNAALDILENLLRIPSQLSGPGVKLDPAWAPLRDSPRFQKLVAQDGRAESK